MTQPTDPEVHLPIAEERIAVHKRTVERGRVRVRTVVDEQTRWVRESLMTEDVVVERVAVNREVESPPPIRQEGDVTVIPIVEEVLVTERRLVVKEEVRLRKERRFEPVEQPVALKTMRAVVERDLRPRNGDTRSIQDSGAQNDSDSDSTV